LACLVEYRDDAAGWKDFGDATERLNNLSPGRAVVHALKSFLQRRCKEITMVC